uniref:uncharacterized protein LOC123459276 isoform X4 n=1 Tax=Jaculus jaculus TaxID=51337 RepID=UPI001E1B23B5|nr:uncharacterized protein LOC123459276 isoform X4 [Jaculus jaculus]
MQKGLVPWVKTIYEEGKITLQQQLTIKLTLCWEGRMDQHKEYSTKKFLRKSTTLEELPATYIKWHFHRVWSFVQHFCTSDVPWGCWTSWDNWASVRRQEKKPCFPSVTSLSQEVTRPEMIGWDLAMSSDLFYPSSKWSSTEPQDIRSGAELTHDVAGGGLLSSNVFILPSSYSSGLPDLGGPVMLAFF